MTAPTPLEMAQQTHRPAADGTRRLTWRDNKSLRLGQSKHDHTCEVTAVHQRAGTPDLIPAGCQRTIPAGRYFLLHTPIHPSTGARGRRTAWCAPCAVRDWSAFNVREVDP